MPTPPVHVDAIDDVLAAGLASIRAEMDIVDPPPDAVAEAIAAVAVGPTIPAVADMSHVPFVTLDPVGSRDLDQALHITAEGDGWTVFYAIADVASFVAPGGAIDEAARARGVTIYLPDSKSPLHPVSLSEGAASLLPGQVRQALVWQVEVTSDGVIGDVDVRRAQVRSRGAYDYGQVQEALDGGGAEEVFQLLKEVGLARQSHQAERGGLDLRLPEQVVARAGGSFDLEYRAPLAAEDWNAQISLLVGECAARIMLDAGVGVLRTLPPPSEQTVDRLRRHARALGVPWSPDTGYADFVRGLDPSVADEAALIVQSATLARGAGYLAFTDPPEGDVTHSAVAAPYAHVTAPLRRLVDRFANEIVLAACGGGAPPGWAVAALAELPGLMGRAGAREHAVERMVVSLAEAAVLTGHLGEEVEGVVVDVDDERTSVQLRRPAVVADVADPDGSLGLGDEVRLRVVAADPAMRSVVLEPVR